MLHCVCAMQALVLARHAPRHLPATLLRLVGTVQGLPHEREATIPLNAAAFAASAGRKLQTLLGRFRAQGQAAAEEGQEEGQEGQEGQGTGVPPRVSSS